MKVTEHRFSSVSDFAEDELQKLLTQFAIYWHNRIDPTIKRVGGRYEWGIIDQSGQYVCRMSVQPDRFAPVDTREVKEQQIIRNTFTGVTQ